MNVMAFVLEQWMLIAGLAVLVALFIYREFSQGGPRLSVHELTMAVNNNTAVVLDVRNSNEFKNGHIVDAINIPHTEIDSNLERLNKYRDKHIIIVDKMGQHAGTVGRQLKAKGFRSSQLRGGITEWQQQKLPLIK